MKFRGKIINFEYFQRCNWSYHNNSKSKINFFKKNFASLSSVIFCVPVALFVNIKGKKIPKHVSSRKYCYNLFRRPLTANIFSSSFFLKKPCNFGHCWLPFQPGHASKRFFPTNGKLGCHFITRLLFSQQSNTICGSVNF